MHVQTYKYNFFETLNLNTVLKFTMKLSKMRSSFQNLDMFQFVSTYDTAYNISHLCPLYISKIPWIFETGNITLKCKICMNINFWTESYFQFKSLCLTSDWFLNDIIWNLITHILGGCACKCAYLLGLRNTRDVFTFENQCKYHANQIWNFNFIQKASFTATNFIHKQIQSFLLSPK